MSATLRLSRALPSAERPRRLSQPIEDKVQYVAASIPDVTQPLMRARLSRIVSMVSRLEDWATHEITADAVAAGAKAGHRLRRKPTSPSRIAHVLALGRAVCSKTLGLRPYDVQIMGAAALLLGRLVEMETGEGKTLTAGLAAVGAALSGRSTHVVTVNDYLARRDAETLGPLYGAFSLSVGLITHDLTAEQRRDVYDADVVYVTNKELTFDYLRDRMRRRPWPNDSFVRLDRLSSGQASTITVLQGLHFAIVDEADSIMIDEARTPLILSETGQENFGSETAQDALTVAALLDEGQDYVIDGLQRSVEMTEAGLVRTQVETRTFGPAWSNGLSRADLIKKALTAQHIFKRDIHYTVLDSKVQIIDEYTGRLMPDRFWSDGLHQMVEIKEGLAVSDSHLTMARITYQRFFSRYVHLCGMSGTLDECRRELRQSYRLKIARIPTHRASKRRFMPAHVHETLDAKWTAIATLSRDLSCAGRPVLIGTRTVAASRIASRYLEAANVDHVVLNAVQDDDEAAIIAGAGRPGRVTVATNLAGRGTDIHLSRDVVERGGLAVVMTERHEAARIDRQLSGRCGRQGDPGTVHVVLSLEDDLLETFRTNRLGRALIARARRYERLAFWLIAKAQRRSERLHYAVRCELLRLEERLARSMAFTGPQE